MKVASDERSLRVGGSSSTSASPPSALATKTAPRCVPVNRLGEDQVAGAQVYLHIFFVEVKIENAIALGGIKGDVLDFIAQVRRGKGESRT